MSKKLCIEWPGDKGFIIDDPFGEGRPTWEKEI